MSNDTCGMTPDLLNNIHKFAFIVYNVATPIFAIFGFFGQIVMMFALIKRFKSEQVYAYQLQCASADAAAAVIKILFLLSLQTDPAVTGDYRTPFQDALARCYAWVWFSARMARPLGAGIVTLCLLLTTMMAADRVLALLKPMAHKNANHAAWRWGGLVVCTILSFSASAFDVKLTFVATIDESRYAMATDVLYANQPFVRGLAFCRVFLQAFGLVTLASLSVALCYLYRTRVLNQKAKLRGDAAHAKAKRSETVLITLSLFQCLHAILYVSMGLSITAFIYCFPSLYACWRGLLNTTIDLTRMTLDACNFYGVLIVSKKVREVVKSVFPCVKNDDSLNKVVELKIVKKM